MQKTNFPFELIIHDDASTDNTADIIRSYEQKHPDIIKPIYESENQYSKGPYDFINDMFRSAKGKYLAFCEGDDFWTDPDKLQIQVDFMESHPDYSLCFHPVKVFFENGEEPEFVSPGVSADHKYTVVDLFRGNFIYTNSVMYRTQDYNNLPNNVMPQDWYLHLYHARFGKIGFIGKTMAAHRRHAGGVWWVSYKDTDKLWEMYGLAYLRLYRAVLNIYGGKGDEEYLRIIDESIISMFSTLRRLDREKGGHLLKDAFKEFPEQAEVFVHHDYKAMEDKDKEINRLQQATEEYGRIIAAKDSEIGNMKASKVWKAKTAGRKAVTVARRPKRAAQKAARIIKRYGTKSDGGPV